MRSALDLGVDLVGWLWDVCTVSTDTACKQ